MDSWGNDEASGSGGDDSAVEAAAPASAGRLLVVDDSVMVQKLLVAALTRLNFEVETAKNGYEALEKMTRGEEPYVVVLMDFLMPVLDGISATAMFRDWEKGALARGAAALSGESSDNAASECARRRRQLVVGISANAEAGDVDAAKIAGVDHFLTKPVKIADIAQYISENRQ